MERNNSGNLGCSNCKIRHLSLFGNGSVDANCELFQHKEEKIFKKGEKLISDGDAYVGFFCIHSGTIKIYKPINKKDDFILWFAKPGESLGIDSFFNNENYQYSASATGLVKACFFSTPKITELMQTGSVTYLRLMEYFCKRIDFIEKRITSIAQKKTKAHLAELLIALSETHASKEGREAKVDYTIKDLANIIGTTQNYLYKISSELIKDKIISFQRKKLKILDQEKLAILAKGSK